MDGALGRLYRRIGAPYGLLIVVIALLSMLVLVTLVTYITVVSYLGLGWEVFLRILRLGLGGEAVAVAVAVAIILGISRPVFRWMGGTRDAETAAAAWEAAVRLPTRLVIFAPVPLVLGAVPGIRAVSEVATPEWYVVAALFLGVVFVVALGLALNGVACETVLRPVLLEIDAAFPSSGFASRREGMSIRRRIVASSVLVVYMSAWLAMGTTSGTTDPVERLGVTIVAGLGVSLTFGLVLTLALSQSLIVPLRDLIAATRRVRAGEVQTRVSLISNDELGQLARSFNEMTAGLVEREALRSALGTYIEPGIADRLLREGEFLTGEEVDVTIMFVDIVGFTARAEKLTADAICADLNEFFGLIVPVIGEHGGHTNKLLGDGFMAVFGTPLRLDDHADRALAAACEIQERMRERYGSTLRVGVGLNTGAVVVGTTGGGTKLDFTVIGDAVNVAQRVEALTRETGDEILVAETTRDALRVPGVALAPRGSTQIKGRAAPVYVFAAQPRIPA